jgi:hypothetical protein
LNRLNDDETPTNNKILDKNLDEILEVDEITLKKISKSISKLPSEIKIQKILLDGTNRTIQTTDKKDDISENDHSHCEIEILDHSKSEKTKKKRDL